MRQALCQISLFVDFRVLSIEKFLNSYKIGQIEQIDIKGWSDYVISDKI